MTTRKLILKTGILCLLSVAAFATDPIDVFQRSQVSDKYVSYRGMKTATLCCKGGPATAILKVVHLKPDKTRTEYFAPSFLAGAIFIQDGSDSWRYSPSRSAWKPLRCHKAQLHDVLSREAIENYNLRLVGTGKLAGRSVYEIYAVPKCPGEAARRLWIDRDHYVVMGTQVETSAGRVLTRSEFTKIDFNPVDISPSIFKISGKVEDPVKPAQPASFKVLKPTYIPSGYKLIGVASLMVKQSVSVHLQYSNGANTISVFQRKTDSASTPPKGDGKLLNVLTCARAGMQFTLIGNVSRSELRKMADSLH